MRGSHDSGSSRGGRACGRREQPRTTTARQQSRALCQNLLAGKIGHDSVKLAVGASAKRLPQALVELVRKQPALVSGAPQMVGDLCAIGVRCSHVAAPSHLRTIPRQAVQIRTKRSRLWPKT